MQKDRARDVFAGFSFVNRELYVLPGQVGEIVQGHECVRGCIIQPSIGVLFDDHRLL
jgi:hypothetical protein